MKEITISLDKETKKTYRYIFEENKKGISGSIYFPKGDKPPPEKKKIKISKFVGEVGTQKLD